MMETIKAIIFDMDGVIFDSETMYINDLIRLREKEGVIVHGIGTGVLRKEVSEYLRHDRRVLEYKLDFMNPGCTIIKLKDNLTK